MIRSELLLGAVLLAATSPGPAEDPGETCTAVLTQLRGNVVVAAPAVPATEGAVRREVGPAWPGQVVAGSREVLVPPQGRAGLLCSTDHWVLLEGESRWRLTPEACRRGTPLPPGTYAREAPRAGRIVNVEGHLLMERRTRSNSENPVLPTLLTPRDSAVLTGRPPLHWTQVPGAFDYVIERTGARPVSLPAGEVPCARHRGAVEEPICTVPYPAGMPELEPGETSYLRVGVRLGLGEDPRRPPEPSRVTRLPSAATCAVEKELGTLAGLAIPEAVRLQLQGALLAERGLWSAAIDALERSLALVPEAPVRVTLADLYLKTGLHRPAYRTYLQAARESDAPAVQAAVEFGLGKLHSERLDRVTALRHLRRALAIYERLGLEAERAAAAKAVAGLAGKDRDVLRPSSTDERPAGEDSLPGVPGS